MQSDLVEAFDRLSWCNTEIQAIENTIEEFVASCPYTLKAVPLYAEKGANSVVVLNDVKPIPTGVSYRAGTTLNEMRSILDSLASTLATRNGAASTKDVYFPVANSEDK